MAKQEWIAVQNPVPPYRVGKHSSTPGEALIHRVTGLGVIETTDVLPDGRRYMHLSISHQDRYPTWEEILMVKEHMMGDAEAVQILPKKSEYVNVHPNCFHIWMCYDGRILEN